MKQKKKKSLFPLVFSILTALALLIGSLDVFAYLKYYRSGKFKSMMHPVEKVDMTDPDGNTNYGRIYYSPIDEEHIVEYEQDSGCGYIDNEVLVVANEWFEEDRAYTYHSSNGSRLSYERGRDSIPSEGQGLYTQVYCASV